MVYEGPERSCRKLVRVEGQGFRGWWGCSECAWVFNPFGPSADESLDEMKRTFKKQLSAEFDSHACAEHPRVKGVKLSS